MVKYSEIFMITPEKIVQKLKEDFSLQAIVKVVLLLLIVLLFQATYGVWKGLFAALFSILRPFIYGFVIAYILRRIISVCERRGISNKVSIPLTYLVIILLLYWLLSSLIPMILSRSSAFIGSVISGISWVEEHMSTLLASDIPPWISTVIDSGVSALSDARNLLPSVTGSLPEFFNATVDVLTTAVISTVISIFMLFEWDQIRYYFVYFSCRISLRCYQTVFTVNQEIDEYLKSMLMLTAIRFIEYSLLYYLVGHPDWLILGILTAFAVFIPYVGPVIITTIGILTLLIQSVSRTVILLIAIVILSQVDEYLIAPLVHARNTHVSPLMTLFSIYAGGTLLGIPGIIIALPVFLALRTVYRIYFLQQEPTIEKKEADG